jgi:hypothetical protein
MPNEFDFQEETFRFKIGEEVHSFKEKNHGVIVYNTIFNDEKYCMVLYEGEAFCRLTKENELSAWNF